MLQTLQQWSGLGLIRSVDYQFAKLIASTSDETVPDSLVLLAALVSHQLAEGNVCLPLSHLDNPENYWPEEIAQFIRQHRPSVETSPDILGTGENVTPLVMDQRRIYLYRYWNFEVAVAEQLLQRAKPVATDNELLKQSLTELFQSGCENSQIDWQQVAAAVAVQKRFSVISGGPGTGKTTTVIKLLVLYIQQMLAQGKSINIHLAAPTGKAAARLSESISAAKQKLDLEESIANLIPTEASTLHRLLGVIPNRVDFRHNQNNPLHLDLLVLDEASMIDLPMMARLLAALPEQARLVLLGDRDQLASVEAGSVLGDICSWPGELGYSSSQVSSISSLCGLTASIPEMDSKQSFSDSLCLLRKSYRFDENSGIGYLARAVNKGDFEEVRRVISAGYADLEMVKLSQQTYETMINQAADFHAELFRSAMQGSDHKTLLNMLSKFQLLCALREGPYGIAGLNGRIEDALRHRGLIRADSAWYLGRPVMITRNDNSLSLFNGDIGLTLPDIHGRLKVWFEQNGEMRSFLPSRLPEHETVYAMTVHKSQGSEFDHVALLLPPGDIPVLSRELLYTGITRAKSNLSMYAQQNSVEQATNKRTERSGGLKGRLW